MNMVALLVIPLVMPFDNVLRARVAPLDLPMLHTLLDNPPPQWIRWLIVAICLVALLWAVIRSKSETGEMRDRRRRTRCWLKTHVHAKKTNSFSGVATQRLDRWNAMREIPTIKSNSGAPHDFERYRIRT